ncbi:MAG: tetratricopeptide repeat protein [Acidobacteriaceae bacterium]
MVLLLSAAVCSAQATPNQQELSSHLQKVLTYLHQNRPDLAIPELQAALAIDPSNLEVRANLGVLLFFQGKYDQALPLLQAVVASNPNLWKIQSLLGIAERKTGDDHQGRLDLETAFPHIDETKLKIDVGLQLIESYTATAELDKASALIAQLLALKPTDPELLYAAYRIHSNMMAEDLLSLSLAAPDSAQLHQAIAHELQRTHDLEGTIRNLRQALALDPKLPGIHFELAEALHASDDQRLHTEAVQQYKLAVQTNPTDPKAATRLGDIEVEMGNLDAGEKDYQQALKLQPNSPDAKIGMANVLTERGDPAAAAPLLEQVIAADPSNYLAHFRLSTVYRKLHRPEDVKRELDAYTKYKDMHEKLTSIYKTLDSPDKTPGK